MQIWISLLKQSRFINVSSICILLIQKMLQFYSFKNSARRTYNSTGGIGAYVVLELSIKNKRFTLFNVHAPYEDTHLGIPKRKIKNLPNTECIIVDDWNLVLDPDLDCLYYKHVNVARPRRNIIKF